MLVSSAVRVTDSIGRIPSRSTDQRAAAKGFDAIVPWYWLSIGVGAAFGLGALAGLYPAWRASRLEPAEAVRPAA